MEIMPMATDTKEMNIKILRMDLEKHMLDNIVDDIESNKNRVDTVHTASQYESLIKKTMQKLDYVFLSFEIDGINSVQDLLLSSIRHIHYKSFNYEQLYFEDLESASEDQEIDILYNTLKLNVAILTNNLINEFKEMDFGIMNDLEYIMPLSLKKKCVCTMSVAEFVKFIQTCFKYDELSNIVDVLLSLDNEIIEDLVYISNDLTKGDELFLLEPIDDVVKGEITDTGKLSSIIETDIDKIPDDFDLPKQIDLHTVSCSSIVTFKKMLNSDIRNKIMMENIYKTLIDDKDVDVNIALSQLLMISEHFSEIEQLVELSISLINLINERTHNIKDMILVQLGSFMKYHRYSNNVYKDSKFVSEHLFDTELTELASLMNERYEILKDTKLGKYYSGGDFIG